MELQVKILIVLLIPLLSFSQDFGDDRFGVTLGATNYIMDTNFISSKSAPGFLAGITFGTAISDSFEVLLDFNYNYHNVKLVGRETELSNPEDIRFFMQNLSLSPFIHYKIVEKNDVTFGVNLGVIGTVFYELRVKNQAKENYLIDPLYLEAKYMDFDAWTDKATLNAFVGLGLSAQYKNFMGNLRYNKGITDPYRHISVYSSFVELKGKDNYWAFTITYFF